MIVVNSSDFGKDMRKLIEYSTGYLDGVKLGKA